MKKINKLHIKILTLAFMFCLSGSTVFGAALHQVLNTPGKSDARSEPIAVGKPNPETLGKIHPYFRHHHPKASHKNVNKSQ